MKVLASVPHKTRDFLEKIDPVDILLVVLLLVSFTINSAFAEKANGEKFDSEPHQLVSDVTDELLRIVSGGEKAIKSNPDKFFNDVQNVMEVVVDFNYIAKNVMGAKYWRSATAEQKTRFVEVFTSGLVQTYAKGMVNFADLDIAVQPPNELTGDKRKISVIQTIKGPEGINRVAYTMGRKKTGEWKLINVVIDGINLGETLRSQFSQSVAEHNGDLNATIDAWRLES